MSNLHTINGAGLNGSASLLLVLATFTGAMEAIGSIDGVRVCRGAWTETANASVSMSGSAEIPGAFSGSAVSIGVIPSSVARSASYQASAGATGYAYLLREVPAYFGGDATVTAEFLPNAKFAYFDTTLGSTGELTGHLIRPAASTGSALATSGTLDGDIVRYVWFDVDATVEGRFEASYRASGDAFDQLDGYFDVAGTATAEVVNDKVQVITGFITDLTSEGAATARVEYWSTRFSEAVTSDFSLFPTRTAYGTFSSNAAVTLSMEQTLIHGGLFDGATAVSGECPGWLNHAGRFSSPADVIVSFDATYQHMVRCNGQATAVADSWAPAEHHKGDWTVSTAVTPDMTATRIQPGDFTGVLATAVTTNLTATLVQMARFSVSAYTVPGLMLPFTNQDVLGGRLMTVPYQPRGMSAPYQLRTMVIPA